MTTSMGGEQVYAAAGAGCAKTPQAIARHRLTTRPGRLSEPARVASAMQDHALIGAVVVQFGHGDFNLCRPAELFC